MAVITGGDVLPGVTREADVKEDPSSSETSGRRLVYFAAERTLLSWISTALGLMALGFVIDRFGLIVRQLMPRVGEHVHPRTFSFWGGDLLVICGALMAFVAAGRYLHFSIAYHRAGDTRPRHGILMGVVFAAVVGLFGLVIAVFLLAATTG